MLNKRNNKNSKKNPDANLVSLLKQIQYNTATSIGQQNPDTVVFPILKRVRPYSVILSSSATSYVTSTSLPTFFASSISLNNLNGYSDYINAFDKYRILEVQAEFIPNNIGVNVSGSAIIDTVIDYDDSTVLTSGEQYEYDSCYSTSSGTIFKRTFIPRAALAVYSGVVSTSYAEAKAGIWIDCNSPGVSHYGLKGVIGQTNPVFAMQVVYRVHVQFANQH